MSTMNLPPFPLLAGISAVQGGPEVADGETGANLPGREVFSVIYALREFIKSAGRGAMAPI